MFNEVVHAWNALSGFVLISAIVGFAVSANLKAEPNPRWDSKPGTISDRTGTIMLVIFGLICAAIFLLKGMGAF